MTKKSKNKITMLGVLAVVVLLAVAVFVMPNNGLEDIDDCMNCGTGSTVESDGGMYFGSYGLTSDQSTIPSMLVVGVNTHNQQNAVFCSDGKVYTTYYALPTQAGSAYPAQEKAVYDDYLSQGVTCEMQNTRDDISSGSWHTMERTVFGGATAYSAGQKYICGSGCSVGEHSITVRVRCGDSGQTLVDEYIFTVVDCGDNGDPIAECDAKDTSYCQGGYLYIEDWRLISGQCNKQTSYEQNDACELEHFRDYCIGLGMVYDEVTKKCVSEGNGDGNGDVPPDVDPPDVTPPNGDNGNGVTPDKPTYLYMAIGGIALLFVMLIVLVIIKKK